MEPGITGLRQWEMAVAVVAPAAVDAIETEAIVGVETDRRKGWGERESRKESETGSRK